MVPTPVLLPGKFHGQRSLVGYSPWDHKLSDVTEHTYSEIWVWTTDSGQFSSVIQSCLTPCNPMDCSTSGFPVHHQLMELTQTHVHWGGDAIQSFHSLLPASPAFSHCQHQGLFQWVSSLHQLAKVLEFHCRLDISNLTMLSFLNLITVLWL